MWIFGYGSLIWKVDFPYKRKLPGYIQGFARRFWQGSEDHRGVPGKPGRVATLIPSQDSKECVWGVAYEIAKENIESVTQHLDHREKDGYSKVPIVFHPSDTEEEPFQLQIYVGKEDNPFYLGPADVKDIAQQIYWAKGESGENKEYLFNLAEALKELGPNIKDDHVFEIAEEVRSLSKALGS